MTATADHRRTPGHSLLITREAMLARVVQPSQYVIDDNAFPDLKDAARERSVSYVISPDATAGPAPIRDPHHFHLAVLELAAGVKPVTHAHPYNEVFMPLDATFRFFWGENVDESVEVEPMGVISVPAGVFRTFEKLGDGTGHVMSILDTPGDPHVGIVVPQEMFDKYYRDSGWSPTGSGDESDAG